MKNLGLESKIEILDYAEFTVILESNINDILFKDTTIGDNLCAFPIFEINDVMNSKVNAMKYDFTYLFDDFSDGSVHCIDQNTCIFDIYSICTKPFNISTENEPCILHISKDVTPKERREIEKILIKYSKVFSWTYEDMPNIDRDIGQHYIPTKERCIPIKQKLRRLGLEWTQLVKEDIEKHIKAKFVDYPEWLPNVVHIMVHKVANICYWPIKMANLVIF